MTTQHHRRSRRSHPLRVGAGRG